MTPNNIGPKVMAGLAAGIAGFMTVGSYKAYHGVWQNEADVRDREVSMNARLYREELTHTGNSFVPSIIHYFNRPDMFFLHKVRRAVTYTRGFVRDVLWANAMPLTLGSLAVAWGFNVNLKKLALNIGKASSKTGSLLGRGIKTFFSSLKTILPKVNASKVLAFLTPKSPKGVLTLAATAFMGLFMLPYTFFDAARGDKSFRMSEDFMHRFH